MTKEDLIHRLETTPRYDYMVEQDGSVTVKDLQVDAKKISVRADAIPNLTWPQVAAGAAQGKDVDHITRVTGYMSTTSGWNKGKLAELKDRHRSGL